MRPPGNAEIGGKGGIAGAVDNTAAADDEIELGSLPVHGHQRGDGQDDEHRGNQAHFWPPLSGAAPLGLERTKRPAT